MAEKNKEIGTAPVSYCGKALFLCMEGGTFVGEGVEGTFAASIGGASIVIYLGNVAYQCMTVDIVKAAIAHFKTLPPEVQAKAKAKDAPDGA